MDLASLSSLSNLRLAWRRITTGTNLHYKRFFRDMYHSYELALDENLKDLRSRLKGGSFEPRPPVRIHLPKPSGLQRPLTLLYLEDQIVLQALANLFARRLRRARQKIEFRVVFSNILAKEEKGIFFFKHWRHTYKRFRAEAVKHYAKGSVWIGEFDFAAFYDTISHELLLRRLFPRGGGREICSISAEWFRVWSAEKQSSAINHGIPQGPVASDFLAECFLLPVDLKLLDKRVQYLRYVDDIRLFGKTETEVRRAAVLLEVLARSCGLIPQSAKFAIRRVHSAQEAGGSLPSLPPQDEDDSEYGKGDGTANLVGLLKESLKGRPQRIEDKTKARYVLFRSGKHPEVLRIVLRVLPRNPEHIDAFAVFLSNYNRSKRIIAVCLQELRTTPYGYTKGELWHILARMMNSAEAKKEIARAISDVKDHDCPFEAKWGALHFLITAETKGLGAYSNFVKFQDALLQAFVARILPARQFEEPSGLVKSMLGRSAFEPGIGLVEGLDQNKKGLVDFGWQPNEVPSQVLNVLRAVGIEAGGEKRIDPIGEIISRRFGIPKWPGWRKLLLGEYSHAQKILCQADPVFDSGRSVWLAHQDSFNEVVFRELQHRLVAAGSLAALSTVGRGGQRKKYGVLLDPNNKFSKSHPVIADGLRECHRRRNRIPGSHPYDEKGGAKNRFLGKKEQQRLTNLLAMAYDEMARRVGPLF